MERHKDNDPARIHTLDNPLPDYGKLKLREKECREKEEKECREKEEKEKNRVQAAKEWGRRTRWGQMKANADLKSVKHARPP